MSIRGVEFELGTEGPKVSWRPFTPKMTLERLEEWLQKPLRIRTETARLAKVGLPAPDDMVTSSKQQQIRSRHQAILAEIADQARVKVSRLVAKLTMLGTDVTEAGLANAATEHNAKLGEIEAGFESRIPPLLKRKIETEANRKEFEHVNDTEDQPTASSAFAFVGSTVVTTTVESIVNGLLFKDSTGLYKGMGFSFGVGVTLTLLGMVGGIGWARTKRPQRGQRIAGYALLSLAGVATIFVFVVLAHYRDALLHQAPDPSVEAGRTLMSGAFAPFREAPQVLFASVNLLGLWLITAKASTMFGWIDLARRRKAAEKAARRAERCYEQAIAACVAVKEKTITTFRGLRDRARANVVTARKNGEKRDELVSDYGRWRDAVKASFGTSEQTYRETVQAVHPAGTYQPRFAIPLEPLAEPVTPGDATIDATIVAIDARSIEIEKHFGTMVQARTEETDATCKRISERYAQLEAEARGRPHLRAVN